MDPGTATALIFDLRRGSPFSFKCQVCSSCCYGKVIRVSPYEALRLARNLRLTTTEFYAKYTEDGGTVLRIKPDASCIFLTSKGCSVHPDRPLVCRLFPLGQIVDKEGKERFGSMPPHPDCLGVYGTDGKVEAYLESQGAEAYFHFDKMYAAVYKQMVAKLDRIGKKSKKKEVRSKKNNMSLGSSDFLRSAWLDIDAAVTAYCGRRSLKKPVDLESLVKLHLAAIEDWLAIL
jgi:Fe-S-cluster containining protein